MINCNILGTQTLQSNAKPALRLHRLAVNYEGREICRFDRNVSDSNNASYRNPLEIDNRLRQIRYQNLIFEVNQSHVTAIIAII